MNRRLVTAVIAVVLVGLGIGYGPAAALIVTLIYAVPPMAHVTTLSVARVPPEVLEFARMTGCSPSQMMWRVMIPAIRPRLMVGVNQVIMLTLNMVIIGSLIGAGGLGYDVWRSPERRCGLVKVQSPGSREHPSRHRLNRISQETAARRPIHCQGGFIGAAAALASDVFPGKTVEPLGLSLVDHQLCSELDKFRTCLGNQAFNTDNHLGRKDTDIARFV